MGYKLRAYRHKNRHGTFAFRWRPPRDAAIQFSQASFVYSLGTKENSIARGRALYASIRANQFVSILRAVKSPKDPIFNTELVRTVIMLKEHPVRFGTADGEWTAVTGWLEGTFTKPMVLADGKIIQPTGKAYRIPMATIGHWNKQGIMFEEFLFWDNGEFMKQIGLTQ
jgi:hypothetical protein